MKSLLIASQETAVRESLQILLADEYSIQTTDAGEEVIRQALRGSVDVVFLDDFLCDGNGLEFLTKLAELRKEATVVYLALSEASETAEEARSLGAFEVLSKPLDRIRVVESARRAAERQRALQEIRHLQSLKSSEKPTASKGEEKEEALAKVSTLMGLQKLLKATAWILDPSRFLELILEALMEIFHVAQASIILHSADEGGYRVRGSVGLAEKTSGLLLRAESGLIAWMARRMQILVREKIPERIDPSQSVDVERDLALLGGHICIPLATKGRLLGLIVLGNRITGKGFSESDRETLSAIALTLSLSIENSTLHQEIAKQKKLQENVLNTVAAGVVAINRKGFITTFNQRAAEILDLRAEELLGGPVQKAGSRLADLLLRTAEEGVERLNCELIDPLLKKPLRVSCSVLRGKDAQSQGAVMVFYDESAVRAMENRIHLLERREYYRELAARMAHEVKNPLVAIKTFTQLFPKKYADPEFRDGFFNVVTQEVDRLNGIIERLIQFADPPPLKKIREDVRRLLDESIGALEERLRDNGVKIERRYPKEPLYLEGDTERLNEAFKNLLSNSLDAMPERGRIRICVERHAGAPQAVGIEIHDTGHGIKEHQLERIYSPFCTTKTRGMGLGLPIALRIIEDHGGSLALSSAPSGGTVARIVLPESQICHEDASPGR